MIRWLVTAGAMALWLSLGACGDDALQPGPTSGDPGGVGGGQLGGGNPDGGDGGSTAMGGATSGGVEPLYLGVVANPRTPGAAPPTAADELFAELTAYAAGVRVMGVDVAWDELDSTSLAALSQRVDDYRAENLHIVLTFVIVDGRAAHRPMSFASWDQPAAKTGLSQSLDQVLDEVGDAVDVVLLGRRTDAYLEANASEAASLTGLLDSGIQHLAARGLPRGVGVSYVGEAPSSRHGALAALGDVAAFSYLPGLGADAFPSETSAAKALDTMLVQAAERPVVLHQVGFPSATEVGSSPELQQSRLDSFLAALQPRRDGFPYVLVHQLHDLGPQGCDAWLASQGVGAPDPLGSHWCSTGLWDPDGDEKPAWQRFLVATAHYAQP